MRVELHPAAGEEFDAQVEYFEARRPGLGQRFYHEVISCLDWISANPALARQRKGHRRVNLRIFPFYIVYVIEEDLIWVLAVARGSRKPRYWASRAKSG